MLLKDGFLVMIGTVASFKSSCMMEEFDIYAITVLAEFFLGTILMKQHKETFKYVF